MFYEVMDLSAVLKHSYYGAKGTADNLVDEETGKPVVRWTTAANGFLSRYLEPLTSMRSVLVAVDMGCVFRKSFYPEYKAARAKVEHPKLEIEQYGLFKDWAKKFLAASGATMIGVQGVEADDVIAWLCSAENFSGIVHSVDADLLQLVSPRVGVSLKGEVYTDGMDYHGYPTRLTSLIKSMLGDSSDGYGGVPGFGPKGLEALVSEIGLDGLDDLQTVIDTNDRATLEEAVADRPDSKPLRKLLDNWSTWLDMYRLAKLHPELCWKPRAGKLTKPTICKRVPNSEKLQKLLAEAGADDLWQSKFKDMVPSMRGLQHTDYVAYLPEMKEQMKASSIVAFDYETTDTLQIEAFREASKKPDFVDVLSQDITGVSFCFGEHLERVVYIPVDHRECDNVPLEELKAFFEWIKAERIQLVAQNAPFEGVVTRTCMDIALENVWDTRIMQRYIDENESAHLKDMSTAYLAYVQTTYEEVTGGRKMNELTLDEVIKYGTDDSLVTAHLCDLFQLLLSLEHGWQHYLDFSVAPREVLEAAHVEGANVNWALQKRLADADREAVQSGMAKLRNILSKHVSGEVTVGCKNLIETEKEYVKASLKAKYTEAPDETDEAKEKRVETIKQKYDEWETKLKAACVYLPYTREEVMPKFAFTAKAVGEAAVNLGLPPIEKLTKQSIREYLDVTKWTSADPPDYKKDEETFLRILADYMAKGKDGKAWVEENHAEFFQKILKIEPRIVQSGDELNVGSSDQMKQLLYCKIGVPVRLFGKTVGKGRLELGFRQGAPATDEQAVKAALANDIKEEWQKEALDTLLAVKKAQTRISLFHTAMPLWRHVDGKVHPHITDSGTDTRRPTGSSPNILQMPGHGDGAWLRSIYMPPASDWVCVAADFSGQELRILANESKDPAMLEAYTPGRERDIHSTTAVGIARQKSNADKTLLPLCEFERLNKARKDHSDPLFLQADRLRKMAKGVGFGLAYGAAAPTLSRNLLVPIEEAEEMLEGTLALYKRIKPWQEETGEFMKKHGYTQTAFGTRRHALPSLFSQDKGEVSRMLRQGINATIQSCAAEALKYILTRVVKDRWAEKVRFKFWAPIYDEVVAWVHKDDVVAYWHLLKEAMSASTPPGHTVPQVPELSIGGDWGNCEELGGNPTDEAVLELVAKCIEEEKKVWNTDMKLTWENVYGEQKRWAA